jgi:hypothetical protein
MTAANDLTAEFGGYQRSMKSIEGISLGDRAVANSIGVFISFDDQDKNANTGMTKHNNQ